jgi:REP element-mobilizing transposase RayT
MGTATRHRESIRLPFHDYRLPGAYFVTICTFDRSSLFGHVSDGEMRLNDLGALVERCWHEIPVHQPAWRVDSFVVMPNHFHGILISEHQFGRVVAPDDAPLRPFVPGKPVLLPGSLGAAVLQFKSASGRLINAARQTPGAKVWQRSYYERVLRENELPRCQEYIRDNPAKWETDPNYAHSP